MSYTDPQDQRAYARGHYRRNKELYKARAKAHTKKIRAQTMVAVRELKDVPCADCGESYPYYVMDFDHKENEIKVINISTAVGRGWPLDRVMMEIEKCDVVCANCHRERSWG